MKIKGYRGINPLESFTLVRRRLSHKLILQGRRLPEIRGEYMGQRAWGILCHYIFSGPGISKVDQSNSSTIPYINLEINNDVFESDVNLHSKSKRPVGDEILVGEIQVPRNADQLELWFSNTGRWGTTFDSKYGENYIFDIVA